MKTPEEQLLDRMNFPISADQLEQKLKRKFDEGWRQGMTDAAEIAQNNELSCFECCNWITNNIFAARDAKGGKDGA